jgi:germination protein YpeB
VGDYSQALAVQTAGGRSKSDEQWQTLNKLYKQAQTLNAELRNVESSLSSGALTMSELQKESRHVFRRAGPQLANSNFQVIDKNMQQYPTLIYDGPFSDHVARKTPLGLEGSQTNSDQARDISLKFIARQPNTSYIANVAGKVDGKIPFHRVDITPRPAQNGERITLGVSSQGGKVVWMLSSRSPGAAKLTVREAGDIAGRFLEDRGFKNMESTYYETRDEVAVYNYAATQGGVILYPDQIKVTVALDNGQVTGFDATNYWMAHGKRNLSQPKLTVAQAREKLSSRLEDVTPGRLALIPKTVDSEVLTYEFQGRLDKDVFLVYIDALTGEEVRLLKVIKTNNGVLTM